MNKKDKVGCLALISMSCMTVLYWMSDSNVIISSILTGLNIIGTGMIASMYQRDVKNE